MTTLQDVRKQHTPTYARKRLGMGAISGRQLWATMVKCSCGWTCNINQPKNDAERDWKAHTREEWEKQRDGASGGLPTVAVAQGGPVRNDPAWNDYLRWQERQKDVSACPCCGEKATWRMADHAVPRIDNVRCTGCGLLMEGTMDIGSALMKWNKRA